MSSVTFGGRRVFLVLRCVAFRRRIILIRKMRILYMCCITIFGLDSMSSRLLWLVLLFGLFGGAELKVAIQAVLAVFEDRSERVVEQ